MRAVVIVVAGVFVAIVTFVALRGSPETEEPDPPAAVKPGEVQRPRSGRAPGEPLDADAPDQPPPDGAPVEGRSPDQPSSGPAEAPGVADWIEALGATDNDTVFKATIELAKSGDPAAIDPLIELLQKHTDFYCRLGAATALGDLSSWRAVDSLADVLTDADQLVRAAALDALMKITGHEIKAYSPSGAEDALTIGQRQWREWLSENRPAR